jgi:DNA repair exonuclease SbcCD ATPase subunit
MLGTPDMDQIMTDVNSEFAQYKLFVCKKEKKFVHLDFLDYSFNGRCPADSTLLEQVREDEAKCPQCGKELSVEELKPLSSGDGGSE